MKLPNWYFDVFPFQEPFLNYNMAAHAPTAIPPPPLTEASCWGFSVAEQWARAHGQETLMAPNSRSSS